jgi:hypothetical protein
MMTDYTRTPPNAVKIQQVSIDSVDVVNHAAYGVSNAGTMVPINTAYYVGAVQVTPTVGDQWLIQKINGEYRLLHRIPFNDPNAIVTPTQGQHVVGSGQGPVELQGTQINANAPLAIQAVTTATRPTGVPAGTHVFDTTISKPIWYSGTGTTWVDGTGASV